MSYDPRNPPTVRELTKTPRMPRVVFEVDDADLIVDGLTREDAVALIEARLVTSAILHHGKGKIAWFVFPMEFERQVRGLAARLGLAIRPGVGKAIVERLGEMKMLPPTPRLPKDARR